MTDDAKKVLFTQIPLGRLGKPQDVAQIIALAALKWDAFAWRKGGIDEQPGAAKIGLRHQLLSRFHSLYPKNVQISASCVAMRRAVAQFDGLLRIGRNHK